MLFCEARKAARSTTEADFVPLHQQDTALWDKPSIDQANQILWHAASLRQPGAFQLEAAIQSAHCQRLYTGVVPWQGIAQLYEQLVHIAPTLGAHVGHAVATGEAHGAAQGLALVTALERSHDASALAPYQPLAVARAYLLVKHGNAPAALASYTQALALTQHSAQRAYLQKQIELL
jgi:RNA polymerase sigma-70 factor, ECF subfamily